MANRIIDLSYTAATRLDMIRDGTAFVEVRSVDAQGAQLHQPLRPGTAPASHALYVQAGAFADAANSERLWQKLRAAGIGTTFVRKDTVGGSTAVSRACRPVPRSQSSIDWCRS